MVFSYIKLSYAAIQRFHTVGKFSFTNRNPPGLHKLHGYDCARNVHTNGVTRAQKFVYGIDSSM